MYEDPKTKCYYLKNEVFFKGGMGWMIFIHAIKISSGL